MKRCPDCRRDYYDDTLVYCLDDGAALLEGPGSIDEPATAVFGVPRSEARTRIHSSDLRTSTDGKKRFIAAAAVILLAAIGGFVGYRYFTSVPSGEIRSIAVLPFDNRSSDSDTEYLSDGLTESLIYRLSQIPDLRVSPRSVVFRYRGEDLSVEKIGSELGVDAVVSGRFVQRGDSLTISA